MQAAIISPNSSMDNLFYSDSASNEIIIRDMLCIDIFFLKRKLTLLSREFHSHVAEGRNVLYYNLD